MDGVVPANLIVTRRRPMRLYCAGPTKKWD